MLPHRAVKAGNLLCCLLAYCTLSSSSSKAALYMFLMVRAIPEFIVTSSVNKIIKDAELDGRNGDYKHICHAILWEALN